MTTIAIDAFTIAADRQMTHHNNMASTVPGAKIRRRGDHIFALAGIGEVDDFAEWYMRGQDLDVNTIPPGDWTGAVWDGVSWCLMHNDSTMSTCINVPFAFGSGGPYALGALLAGADARKAVAIATKCDIYTGHGCTVVPYRKRE